MATNPLPTPATTLIGRDADLAAVAGLFGEPDTRLVTVTGPPGVGKTTLAVAVATQIAQQSSVDTAWVDLAPIDDPELVLPEIGRALGASGLRSDADVGAIAAAIGAQETLLVVDNFEHVLAAATALGALVTATSRLKVLATSRERTQLSAEREYPLGPLAMPDPAAVGDPARLANTPAVALLVARAPAHVTVTRRTAADLADICVRLDGLPLAIELAAARLRVFSPAELTFRLDHRLSLLTGGSRDAPDRHRDLRAAVSWSYELLPEREQAAFRALSVLRGVWTLEAAAAVCGPADGLEIVDTVASLLDKNLVRRAGDASGDTAYFSMLMSLREFAAEQLVAHGEQDAAHARHAAYYVDSARRWESHVGTLAETETWALLGTTWSDLLAALDRTDSSEARLWLATALGWYFYTRGSLADAARMLDTVNAADTAPEDVRAAALVAGGVVAYGRGDMESADRLLSTAADICVARADDRRLAVIAAFRGHVARVHRRFDDAAAQYAVSQAIYDGLDDARGRAWASHDRGLLAAERGDLPAGERDLRTALTMLRELGYTWAVAVSSGVLAMILLARDTEAGRTEAAGLLGAALSAHVAVGDQRGIAQCLETLAGLATMRGHGSTAARLLGAAAARREAAAASVTEPEQARIEAAAAAIDALLGRDQAARERQVGHALALAAAIDLAEQVVAAHNDAASDVTLTERQHEVAALIAQSRTNRQIARTLGISEKTAEVHVRHLMQRLGASNRAGVAAWVATHPAAQRVPDRSTP